MRTALLALLVPLAACNGGTEKPAETGPDCTLVTYYRDLDGDGYGDDLLTEDACSAPDGYVEIGGDCNDNADNVNPDIAEVCDGRDEDCSGVVDDNAEGARTWFADADGDTYGDPASPLDACSQPVGYVGGNTDCDDTDADVHPGGTEICDGADQDCDGVADDGLDTATYYADADGDAYGDPEASLEACAPPDGYVVNSSDCDDGNADISPGGDEVCNDIDDDCDELVDEEADVLYTSWFVDADGDGFGDPDTEVRYCDVPKGRINIGDDCDDTDLAINPAATEICNGVDDDCDAAVDDADPSVDLATSTTWYLDSDGDGDGDPDTAVDACSPPTADHVLTGTDCDDDDVDVFPAATEVCNGVDDDCDALVDLDDPGVDLSVLPIWYDDLDGDGFGDPAAGVEACTIEGASLEGTDCDDTDPLIFPGAAEICEDGIDDDCDGADRSCDGHMTEVFVPTNSTGWYCGGAPTARWAYFGETTFQECQTMANITGTQWYVGISTSYTSGWIGDAAGTDAYRTNPADWTNEARVTETSLASCVLAQLGHRTEATVAPVEEYYTDAEGRDWVYWQIINQTHSQAMAFADDRGARIVAPDSVGRTGEPWFTAPTHWCHAGAQYNGGSNCNTDSRCNFLVGYWE